MILCKWYRLIAKKSVPIGLFFVIFLLQNCNTAVDKKTQEYISLYQNMAAEYMALKKFDRALQELRRVEKMNPQDVKTLNLLGLTYLGLEKPEVAKKILQKAVKIDPEFYSAYLNLAICYLEVKSYKKAIRVLKRIDTEAYEFPEKVHNNLGIAYRGLKKNKLAEKSFSRALMVNPTFYPAYLQLGLLKMLMGDFGGATKTLLKAARYCSVCVRPLYYLGVSYQELGKISRSQYYFDQVIRTEPGQMYAKKAAEMKKGLKWKKKKKTIQ